MGRARWGGIEFRMTAGCQSDVDPLGCVLIKHARDAFASEEAIERQWRLLNYTERPDLARAVDEYEGFVALLSAFNTDISFLPRDENVGLDSLYVRDSSIACSKGMILCQMGKDARGGEPAAVEGTFRALGVPICGAITGEGRIEGGDVVWIDERTLAVGRGYRTNDEGIRQLRGLVDDCIDELIVAPLPHWRGVDDVFHLMSILSPIDRDLALVYSPLMPIPLREALMSRGIELVEVPDAEFDTLGCNVLAVAPRKCIMLAGNEQTRGRLEAAGVEVREYRGLEISVKGGGGPTCLTRPISRGE